MNIQHEVDNQCFLLKQPGLAESAVLKYRHVTDDTVDFYSTFVPPALRNQGIAEKLVRFGLDWAKRNELTIEASCWYVQKFIRP